MNSYTADNNQASELHQNLALLQALPFFDGFSNKAMKLIAFLAERSILAPGDILFEEGDDHGRAYLILSGQLTLSKKSGKEKLAVQQYGPGDFLGSFSLLGAMPALFVLQATSKSTVLTISRELFAKILEQFPESGKLTICALLRELRRWEKNNLAKAEVCCLGKTGATVL